MARLYTVLHTEDCPVVANLSIRDPVMADARFTRDTDHLPHQKQAVAYDVRSCERSGFSLHQ